MKCETLLDAIGMLNDNVIQEAKEPACPRRRPLKRKWVAVAAAALMCVTLSIPALAATVPAFYEALYAVSPATAQFFKPVQMACEDKGIRMEVEAAYIHENTAQIYISMQDLEGERVDETMDLFDSYSINTSFDSTSHCELAGYDPETQTATFLITIEQWGNQPIVGKKLTFSIQRFLSHKEEFEGEITGVDLENAPLEPPTQTADRIRGYDGTLERIEQLQANGDRITALQPQGAISSPVQGVTITGIGYVDGDLHIQAHFQDILNTDNHGYVYLVDRISGETLFYRPEGTSGEFEYLWSFDFWDEEGTGSYQEFVFPQLSPEELKNYLLYGRFVTSDGPVSGNWTVTFPLENSDT